MEKDETADEMKRYYRIKKRVAIIEAICVILCAVGILISLAR